MISSKNHNKKIIFKIYFILSSALLLSIIKTYSINKKKKEEIEEKLNNNEERVINPNNLNINNISFNNCYKPLDFPSRKIIHIILTRFLRNFIFKKGFPEYLETQENFIPKGIDVMKKYLFPSLERQRCKDFIWILDIGNAANITYVKKFFNFKSSFRKIIIYEKDLKNYIRNLTTAFDILISTRYDYDDIIYYDAVNDVRKLINEKKPMFLHGYNRGLIYFEKNGRYYDFEKNLHDGVMSVFPTLITVLGKVNDSYTIHDLGNHVFLKKTLLKNYKSFGN